MWWSRPVEPIQRGSIQVSLPKETADIIRKFAKRWSVDEIEALRRLLNTGVVFAMCVAEGKQVQVDDKDVDFEHLVF